MGLVHGYKLWLNCDVFVLNRASNCITEDDDPLVLDIFDFGNKDTVFATSDNFLESPHVFDVLFID